MILLNVILPGVITHVPSSQPLRWRVQTTIHRLDEPGAQNRGIRLINKAAKAAGGCLLTGWVLIQQNMIRRCAIIVSAIFIKKCSARTQSASSSVSVQLQLHIFDHRDRQLLQQVSESKLTSRTSPNALRSKSWDSTQAMRSKPGMKYDQIWPDMTSMSSYEHMRVCFGCGCMSNQLSKEKNRTCKCAAILQPHVATQYRDGCMLCSPVSHSPPCLCPRCCPLWSRPQHIGWSSWVVTTCRVGPKSDLTQLRLKQIGGEVLPQPVGSWFHAPVAAHQKAVKAPKETKTATNHSNEVCNREYSSQFRRSTFAIYFFCRASSLPLCSALSSSDLVTTILTQSIHLAPLGQWHI